MQYEEAVEQTKEGRVIGREVWGGTEAIYYEPASLMNTKYFSDNQRAVPALEGVVRIPGMLVSVYKGEAKLNWQPTDIDRKANDWILYPTREEIRIALEKKKAEEAEQAKAAKLATAGQK